jgi:hypothetical protein
MTSTAMDAEWLQNLEEQLRKQAEATRATNELISQLFSMMRTQKVDGNIATPPSPSVSLPSLATSTRRGVLHPCQGTPAVVPTRANIRASALNKGSSGDPGARSIIGHARVRTSSIRYIY